MLVGIDLGASTVKIPLRMRLWRGPTGGLHQRLGAKRRGPGVSGGGTQSARARPCRRAGLRAGAVAFALTAAATGVAPSSDPLSDTLRLVVRQAQHPYLRRPSFPSYRDDLEAIYAPRGYAPFWFTGERLRPVAAEAVELLMAADARGLHAEDYDGPLLLAQLLELQRGASLAPAERALFDAALSVGVLRLVSDLSIGRANPIQLGVGLDVEGKKWDLAGAVGAAVAGGRVGDLAEAAEPPFEQYRRLKALLSEYRALAARPDLVEPLPEVRKLQPGDAYPALGALAHRLVALGDLSEEEAGTGHASAADAAGPRYAGAIVEGVKRFQARHGLAADGVLGKGSFAALNVPLAWRVRQIELALERLRWLPDLRSEQVVFVNIPTFRLYAFDPATPGRPALEMAVVVGRAVETRTPLFLEEMRYVVFRPYWDVPYAIAVREVVPRLRREPGYLAAQDLEIVPVGGEADAQPPTPENLDRIVSGALRLRQRPGPRNSLGPAKFIFPNVENVYLHGTPARELFARSRRDFSHGCVRVEDPVALAVFVLRDQPDWTPERIREAMAGSEPLRADLAKPLPVVLFYTTVAVGRDGRPLFAEDVYGHDAVLDRVLLAGYSYPP